MSRYATAPRILVVDDEPLLRTFVARVLEAERFSVLTAGHGHEALTLLEREREPVQVVITDVTMPGLGGVELAHRLARWMPPPGLILMSGYSFDAVARLAELGSPAFLRKPFTAEVLLAAVRRTLDGGALPGSLPA